MTTLVDTAGYGQSQSAFEAAVREILLKLGRPAQSPDILEELEKRGIAMGRNPVKATWNRLWQAKKYGVLVNIRGAGYWLADIPVPKEGETVRQKRRNPRIQRTTTRPRGRPQLVVDHADRELVDAALRRRRNLKSQVKKLSARLAEVEDEIKRLVGA